MCSEDQKNWFARISYLHYLYIIFILLGLLIGGFAYYHCSDHVYDKNLHSFISFAATISSIILSTLAIFITVISGESMNRFKDGFLRLSKLPEEVSSKIEKSIEDIQEATGNMKKSAEENSKMYQENATELKNSLEELRNFVGDKMSGVQDTISGLSASLASQKSHDETNEGEKEKSQYKVSEKGIEVFLKSTSPLSINLIYVIDKCLEMEIKAPVSLEKIAEINGHPLTMSYYLYAFCVALNSFGLMDYAPKAKGNLSDVYFHWMSETLRTRYGTYYDATALTSHKKDIDNYLDGLKKLK